MNEKQWKVIIFSIALMQAVIHNFDSYEKAKAYQQENGGVLFGGVI